MEVNEKETNKEKVNKEEDFKVVLIINKENKKIHWPRFFFFFFFGYTSVLLTIRTAGQFH